jgi:NADPH-dependent curcumin reductase CurA
MTHDNHQWLINARPNGRPLQDGDFLWTEGEVRQPAHGEVLVKVEVLGFDPAQKGWMENVANYAAATQIGDVMRASGVGEVVESADPRFAPGDKVSGQLGWQNFATLTADSLMKLKDDECLTANLSVLGNTGLTALFGMNKIGKPLAGDTLVVTGAAGATGSVAGQIGKIAGCRVIGIAGGKAKCDWLTDGLKFDAAIDYKAGDVRGQLRELAPDGIDIVWDNVGGPMLDDLLARIATHARVVICGGIARYEAADLPPGPTNYFNLVFQRATMQGLLLTEYASEFAWGRKRLKAWLKAGELHYREDWQTGLENAPATLSRLFSGENFGKQLLRVT